MAGRTRLRTQRSKRRRLVPVLLFLGLLVGCYFAYVNKNQVLSYIHTLLQTNPEILTVDDLSRGVIYDRNLKELAVSMDKVSVYATVRELGSLQEAAMRLAPALNRSEKSLLEKLKTGSIQVWLAENITQKEEAAVRSLGLKGVFIHREKVRYYPQKEKAAHFLGYSENQMGLAGIEYRENQWLNQYGKPNRNNRSSVSEVQGNGERSGTHNLILTIDLKIQDILYKYVTDIGGTHKGIRLGAMVMEAKTGDVIGYVDYPSYDPNRFREYKKSVLADIFVESAAIPHNIRLFLKETASLESENEKQGAVLPWDVTAGTMDLGSELRLWEKLGLNEQPSLDFVAENGKPRKLKLVELDADSELDTSSVPKIATPIQVLIAMSSILDGGNYVAPRVVDPAKNPGLTAPASKRSGSILSGPVDTEAQHLFQAMSRPGPLSSETITGDGLAYEKKGEDRDYLRSKIMLTKIPLKDSALILMVVADLPGFDPAASGKTGTVDLVTPGLKMLYSIVSLQQVMTHLSDLMTAEEKEKMNYRPAETQKETITERAEIHEASPGQVRMPNLMGLSLRKSLRLLKGLQMEIRVHGTGRVIAQDPPAGVSLSGMKVCTLSLQPLVDKNRPGNELHNLFNKEESINGKGNGKK